MASVYEKAGKWYLRWKGPDARWRDQVSTARSKTEARRLAGAIERRAERQRPGLEPLPTDSSTTLGAGEVPLVVGAVSAARRAVCAPALDTGRRKGGLFGLRKSEVALQHGTITGRLAYDRATTKGGHAGGIPIAEVLVPFLEEAL